MLHWTVSYSAAQIRRFLDDIAFDLRMTSGSVFLMDLTATGAIDALEISLIYYNFVPGGVWVSARHNWALVS